MSKIYNNKTNVILIGMPGAGKSTVGVILAKALGYSFCDTDLLIQKQEGKTLQQIISEKGISYFLEKEEDVICSLKLRKHVIATGGSVIYHEKTMKHLKKNGFIIYLKVELQELEKRVADMKTRGIVMGKTQFFYDIYNERISLYEKYADVIISCNKKNIEKIVEEVVLIIK